MDHSETRFAFGENWLRFLRTVDDAKVDAAKQALTDMLGDIRGKTFLDVGCGSGLSSLAATLLGAKVHAFDYDPQSVACTEELQRMYGVSWPVEEGSALDTDYLKRLGTFDIVYSWGVLHHTGDMWTALGNMVPLVNPGGLLFVAIYNDQGWKSRAWRVVKRAYCKSAIARPFLVAAYAIPFTALRYVVRAVKGKRLERGMTIWHDSIDWLGGYPFEVASTKAMTDFYASRGFTPVRVNDVGRRSGCNEMVLIQSR